MVKETSTFPTANPRRSEKSGVDWPARVAGRKGHSFFGYFILSLFFFPLALIMAYLVQDRRVPAAL